MRTGSARVETRWRILVLLVVARLAMGYQFQTVASTAPFLAERLGLGYAEIGSLIGIFMLPGIVVSLPGGWLTARFGDRRICAAGLALMAAGGLLMAAAGGPELLFAGRVVCGAGGVLFNLVLTK